jgi:hypothetical protein
MTTGRPKGGTKQAVRAAAPPLNLKRTPTILEIIDHPDLLRPWMKDPRSWANWRVFLKALFALRMTADELAIFTRFTGRTEAPTQAFTEAAVIVGRRGGKSMVLALIAVYLALFYRDWSVYAVPGERLTLPVIAVDKKRARTIYKYIHAMLSRVPVLRPYLVGEGDGELELSNGVTISIFAASFRSVRGITLIGALIDEVAYLRNDENSALPDYELLDALRPGLATIPDAIILMASSPYSRRGVLWDAWNRYHGKNDAPVLTWKAATTDMHDNPRMRAFVAAAYERDAVSAGAEFGADFRSDLEAFVSADVISSVTIPGRHELPPVTGITYRAFTDPAGGSGGDSFTIAVAHRDKEGRAILDVARERKSPFSPTEVVAEYADLLLAYRCRTVTGDRWGGEYPREGFRKKGITYNVAEQPKSDIYRETLPLLNSGKVELLDLPRLANQFIGLERRQSRSGKDSIDHAPGGRDDLANAVAGALLLASSKAGAFVISDALLARSRQPGRFARFHPLPGPMKAFN